ncbi:MAG: cob(I)yrinic acid a,c-diamide adenosyltransferase [Fimbriimonadales bacterium]
MAKIYTKTGDDGTTGLIGGSRVAKDDARIQVIGDLDELNAALGLVVSQTEHQELKNLLESIQSRLFDLGAAIAEPGQKFEVPDSWAPQLEGEIDRVHQLLSPLKQFILPGGSKTGAQIHLARAICRRAERSLTTLARAQNVQQSIQTYLNRLSDLLFCLARWSNAQDGSHEVKWTPETKK